MGHIKVPVAVHLLLIDKNNILLSRRYNTGFQDGNYSVVAGHVEQNETIIQAMKREVLEEANISFFAGDLHIVQVMYRKSNTEERIDYFLYADRWEGDIQNNEPDKCDDLSWFKLNALPENMVPYVRYAIKAYLNGEYFTEFGWKRKK